MSYSIKYYATWILLNIRVTKAYSIFRVAANSAAQYLGVVLAAASGNFTAIDKIVIFEPIIGLEISLRYVLAAQTPLDRRARPATLAAFFSASIGAIFTTDPATNAALGGTIGSKIGMIRDMLDIRGGAQFRYCYYLLPSIKEYSI